MPIPAKTHSFEDKIKSSILEPWVRALLFGPGGVGKTSFLGSGAFDDRAYPVLLLDFDGGRTVTKGLDPERFSAVPINDWQDYSEAYDFLVNTKHHYKTVCVDSTSETHVYSILNIVDEAYAKNDQGKRTRADNLQVEQNDYGKAMVQMRRFLREFKKLPMHTFYTALSKTENEPREGWVKKPALFGQMAEEIVGMFPSVIYLTMEQVKKGEKGAGDIARYMVLNNEPQIRAKVRLPWGVTAPDVVQIGREDGMKILFDILQVPAIS